MKINGIIHRWTGPDTFEVTCSVKVSGIRTPERSGEQREYGDRALVFAESVAPPGTPCTLHVTGRKVELKLLDGTDFATKMLREGHAGPVSEESE